MSRKLVEGSEGSPGAADRPLDGRRGAAADPMDAIAERVGRITRENERLFQELIAGERRFRTLARGVWRVEEQERRRLARELHDGIGQTLTALKNQLQRLEQRAAREAPEMAVAIAAATALAGQALGDARELSRLLRPPVLDDLGLGPALRWLVRTLGQQTGLQVALEVEVGEPARLAADLETLVFRVVQEGLTNVLKHAGVERAEVAVRVVGDRLELSIADGGRGFDPDETFVGSVADGGSGLRGIQDRVELFGGRFALRSGAGKGTAIEVAVPMSGFAPGEGGDAP